MHISYEPNTCCGCMACADVCPKGAITSCTDRRGFVFPQVNPDLCIECGACEKACAFRREKTAESHIRAAYAFQIRDREQLRTSTSGGAFAALSDHILAEGGVIVAAQMTEDLTVAHEVAADAEGRDRMRMSKYVQSNTEGIFKRVRAHLEAGRRVMFVGTPCQCGQLRQLIGVENDRLLVCDILCRGVPSEAFFREHIRYLEWLYRKKAVSYSFRGKRYGWNHGIEEVRFFDGSFRDDYRVQCYARFFQSGVSLRDSCRSCVYRSHNRPSDITLADFWGLEKITGEKDRDGGSLLLANSEHGRRCIESLSEQGKLSEIPVDQVLYRVSTKPSESTIDVADFWNTYFSEGYAGVVERYASGSVKGSVKHAVKRVLLRRN